MKQANSPEAIMRVCRHCECKLCAICYPERAAWWSSSTGVLHSALTATEPPFHFAYSPHDEDMTRMQHQFVLEPALTMAWYEATAVCCRKGGLVIDVYVACPLPLFLSGSLTGPSLLVLLTPSLRPSLFLSLPPCSYPLCCPQLHPLLNTSTPACCAVSLSRMSSVSFSPHRAISFSVVATSAGIRSTPSRWDATSSRSSPLRYGKMCCVSASQSIPGSRANCVCLGM